MKIRKLGKLGPNVSAIGFGAMSITGFFGPTDDTTSQECLKAAYDCGIDFFDTADVYGSGSSETLIGKFLKDTKAKITRLAKGVPVGGEIENLDDGTLYSAFKNRTGIKTNSD